MRRLLDIVRSRLRILSRDDSTPGSDVDPRYGESVSYVPCPSCGEGSLVYDEGRGESVCNACGAVDEDAP